MLSNLKFAFRSLRKAPGFTVVVVLMLALGIGANTAIFSLFHQVILQRLPVPEPERLVNLSAPGFNPGAYSDDPSGSGADKHFSYPMFRDLERNRDAFAGIAGYVHSAFNVAYRNQVKSDSGAFVSGSYFSVLGVRPALGRLIGPADDGKVNGAYVTVLSYDYWQSRFAGSADVLNETVMINGQPLTVIGVAARGFEGTTVGVKPAVYVPITLRAVLPARFAQYYSLDNRFSSWVNLFARLKPGLSIDRAQTMINVSYRAILNDIEASQLSLSSQDMEKFRSKEIALSAGGHGRSSMREMTSASVMLLFGATALVLLITCANIANLLLARAAGRSGEIALRVSLGATPRQITAQLLTESCLLAACGGILGLGVAYWTLGFIVLFLPAYFAGAISVTLDGTAMLFSAVLAAGTGVIFGLLPAWRSTRDDLLSIIKRQSTPLAAGRGAARVRSVLIASQTVMAMILLVSGGVLLKSLANIGRVDLGLKAESLVTFGISPSRNGYSPERSQSLFERLEDELLAQPGISGVTASLMPVIGGGYSSTGVSLRGAEADPNQQTFALRNWIGSGFFRTLGIPLIAGREFTRNDSMGSSAVVIINEQLAQKLGLGSDAVGQWLAPDLQIVGIVRGSKYNDIKQETAPQFFMPYRQEGALGELNFYVRSQRPTAEILALVKKTVARLDPSLPVERPMTMDSQVDESVFLDHLMSVLCVAFAALAVFLAAIGLYGMLAYSVAQRTREIGVRIALGAQRRAVAWPILRGALRLAGVGVVLGGFGALALTRVIRSILFGVEPDDPMAMIAAAVLLLVVAGFAAWIPARRATKVDPLVALRAE